MSNKWGEYIDGKDTALQMISDLADDCDGIKTVEGLKSLIDELKEIADYGLSITEV